MTKRTKAYASAREFITEILDKPLWWATLKVIVEYLQAKNVEQVRVEFPFVLHRDLARKPQAQDQIVQLSDLESVIRKSLDEGTIEWSRRGDFRFHPLGAEMGFMLCNDADLHFASSSDSMLVEFAHKISASGIKVYDDSGRLI
jgi:hypothetical protein